jgi:high-affinity nickel permease
VLGLRHALDADHLAAVSTFVTEERNLLRSSLHRRFLGDGAHGGAAGASRVVCSASRLVAMRLFKRFSNEAAIGKIERKD